MEQIRASVLAACMLSAAVGVVSLIRPGKAMERQIRFLLSLLFAVSLAAPLTQLEVPPSLDILLEERSAAQQAQLDAAVEAQLITQTQHRAEAALYELLAAQGIECTALSVAVHINEDGCIYFTEASAECSDMAGACRILEEALGEGVSICVTEILSEAPGK